MTVGSNPTTSLLLYYREVAQFGRAFGSWNYLYFKDLQATLNGFNNSISARERGI